MDKWLPIPERDKEQTPVLAAMLASDQGQPAIQIESSVNYSNLQPKHKPSVQTMKILDYQRFQHYAKYIWGNQISILY